MIRTVLFLLCITSCFAQEGIHNPYRDNALTDEAFSSLRRIEIDARGYPNSRINDAFVEKLKAKTADNVLLYTTTYRPKISEGMHEFLVSGTRFTYILQADWTGATAFPHAGVDSGIVDYVYYYQRISSETSLGATTISDVPTTWRNYTGAFRFVLERNELSSAQQIGIVAGIEREILAGMSSAYTSTSTTTRYVDFQQASTGPNDALVQADLVALGWTIVNAAQLEKFIVNPVNGVAYRWRVLHN